MCQDHAIDWVSEKNLNFLRSLKTEVYRRSAGFLTTIAFRNYWLAYTAIILVSFVAGFLFALILDSKVNTKLEAESAEVLRVADGDSITVRIDQTNYRIRLAEIDAPEMDQAWGKESKSALQEKLGNEEVALEIIDVDRYSRLVAKVFLNGRQINREMVEDGHAWVYLEYLKDETLLDPEVKAKRKKLGLWASEAAVAPWQWRKRKRW